MKLLLASAFGCLTSLVFWYKTPMSLPSYYITNSFQKSEQAKTDHLQIDLRECFLYLSSPGVSLAPFLTMQQIIIWEGKGSKMFDKPTIPKHKTNYSVNFVGVFGDRIIHSGKHLLWISSLAFSIYLNAKKLWKLTTKFIFLKVYCQVSKFETG